MLYALSSSLLLLVAGSTVQASPIVFGKAANPVSSVTTSSTSASSANAGAILFENETGGLFIPATTAAATTSKSRLATTVTTATQAVTITSKASTTTGKAAITTSKASTILLTTAKPTLTTGSKGGAGGSTYTVPISTPSSAKSSLASASVTHAATASAKATVKPTAGSGNNGGTALAPGSSCDGTNDGSVVCSADGTLFGLCNFGEAVMMPVSKGTACRNGAIDYIADTLGVALGQVKTFFDNTVNATSVFGTASPNAIDASDCPAALLYLKDKVDAADKLADSSETALRFVNSNSKTVIDDSDVELVLKKDGTAGFQVQHQCGGDGSGNSKRQLYIEWCLL